MGPMSLAHRMRQSICDVLEEVGALAPTYCEGWQAQDLAAHLWIRDRRPDALPGIALPAFAGHTERLQFDAMHRLGFEKLVADLRELLQKYALPKPDTTRKPGLVNVPAAPKAAPANAVTPPNPAAKAASAAPADEY